MFANTAFGLGYYRYNFSSLLLLDITRQIITKLENDVCDNFVACFNEMLITLIINYITLFGICFCYLVF